MTSTIQRSRSFDSDFFVAQNLDLDEKSIFGPGKCFNGSNVVKNVIDGDVDDDFGGVDADDENVDFDVEEEETSF